MEGKQAPTQSSLLRAILPQTVDDPKVADALERLGLEPTYAGAMALSVLKKGSGGDVTAARYIRDTLGEKGDGEEQTSGTLPVGPDLSRYSDEQLLAMVQPGEEEP